MNEAPTRTLLLVDDDDAFRRRLGRALTDRGYEVAPAADGASALELADRRPFAWAVVDLRMPGLDGMQLIEQLRRRDASIRIVVLTGYGSIASALQATRLGACDYLTKPVDADQVETALRGLPTSPDQPSVPSLARLEWEHIQRVLHDTGHNISETARRLGLDRRTLQRKLAKHPPPA